MWILIKFSIFVGTFIYRYFSRLITPKNGLGVTTKIIHNENCYITQEKNKNSIRSTTYTFKCELSHIFWLSHETYWDILFKDLGLTSEVQTGDGEFDQKIYIACDHTGFLKTLIADEVFRNYVKSIFSQGGEKIKSNGKTVSFTFDGDVLHRSELMNACHELMTQIKNIPDMSTGFFSDPLAVKILVVESLIWSIAAYGLTNFLAFMANMRENLYLDGSALVFQGLGIAIGFFCLLLFFIIRFFQLSSRGHRLIVESFFVLLLGVPASSISVLSDLNMSLDSGPTQITRMYIVDRYTQKHRSRRSTSTSYHLIIRRSHNTDAPSRHLGVSSNVYNSVTKNGEIDIEVSPGYFNHAWYKSIKAVKDF